MLVTTIVFLLIQTPDLYMDFFFTGWLLTVISKNKKAYSLGCMLKFLKNSFLLKFRDYNIINRFGCSVY